MTTKLRASLESAISDWIDANCEDDGIPEGGFNPNLSEQMAAAAASVFDANFEGQAYAKRELQP